MTAPIRPQADASERIARNVDAMRKQGATEQDIESYLMQVEGIKPSADQPGPFSRAGSQIAGFFDNLVEHPAATIGGIVKAPFKSAADAFLTPSAGAARPDPRLSKGGNSAMAGSTAPMPNLGTYDREHGAVTGRERAEAAAQTAANVSFPAVAGKVAGAAGRVVPKALANMLGTATAGGVASAAYAPDDPAAAFLSGAAITPMVAGAMKGTGKVAGAGASKVMDVMGRPVESRTLDMGPVQLTIEGLAERAARKNAEGLSRGGIDAAELAQLASDKPMAPLDLAGTVGQRMARGIKTSSAPAEAVFREALLPRAEGAVERVIQHGLETTGLVKRESGLQTVDQLIAERSKHGNENYRPIWEKQTAPIDNPEFAKIANTPAGREALKRGQIIAANGFENIGTIADLSVPPEGVSPADWANVQRIAQERGIPLDNPNAPRRIAPTLQQAHFIKLGFDDMLRSPPEPGSGGSGPINAGKIRDLRSLWLKAMDDASKEYGAARKVYADESALIDAAEVGRNLWKMHPDEAAKAFREMSQAERDVARRTGFDALAERIENGPQDVSKGASKPRDVKRIRLLFPDDASFEQWRQGLREEAQMLASQRGALEGSNTADKLVDMADMVGVALPDVFRALRGNPLPLMARGAKAVLSDRMRANADALAVERAKQLVAGAKGNAAERTRMLEMIAEQQQKRGQVPKALAGLLTPKAGPPTP